MIGEPDAGKPHVRFDEGVQETCGSVTRLCPTLPESPISILFLSSLSVRSSKSSSLQVDRRRCPVLETLVQPFLVVEPEVAFNPCPRIRHRLIIFQVHLLLFQ